MVRVVAAVALWGLLIGYAKLDDRQPHAVGLAAAVGAVLAAVWLCVDAYEVADPPQWTLYHSRPVSRSFDPRFSRLSQELAEASNRQAASFAVHVSVERVADRILLDKYGVDRAAEPATASQILGNQATAFLAADPAADKNVFTPQLSDVLTRLESL